MSAGAGRRLLAVFDPLASCVRLKYAESELQLLLKRTGVCFPVLRGTVLCCMDISLYSDPSQ